MKSLFITGTDTDVGKTYITAGLAITLRKMSIDVGVMKPFAAGVAQKKGKFRILYSPELNEFDLDFFEFMLNPTIKTVALVLLKSNALSQIELVAISGKSNPSVSRALKLLLNKKLIRRNYHAPYSTYEMINKNKIFEYLEKTSPDIAKNFDEFDLCYPKPSIFLTVHN